MNTIIDVTAGLSGRGTRASVRQQLPFGPPAPGAIPITMSPGSSLRATRSNTYTQMTTQPPRYLLPANLRMQVAPARRTTPSSAAGSAGQLAMQQQQLVPSQQPPMLGAPAAMQASDPILQSTAGAGAGTFPLVRDDDDDKSSNEDGDGDQ